MDSTSAFVRGWVRLLNCLISESFSWLPCLRGMAGYAFNSLYEDAQTSSGRPCVFMKLLAISYHL